MGGPAANPVRESGEEIWPAPIEVRSPPRPLSATAGQPAPPPLMDMHALFIEVRGDLARSRPLRSRDDQASVRRVLARIRRPFPRSACAYAGCPASR